MTKKYKLDLTHEEALLLARALVCVASQDPWRQNYQFFQRLIVAIDNQRNW